MKDNPIFLFVLFSICIVVSVCGGLLYLIYIPFKKRLLKSRKLSLVRSKQINKVFILFLIVFSVYQTYIAFFPGDTYYLEEFTDVTLRPAPKTAEVIKKSATYPDFHGDYCSCALIKLSKEDYQKLKAELQNDNRIFLNGKLMMSDEFKNVMSETNENQIQVSFQRKVPNYEDHYLYIGFLKDNQTIVVHKCIT